MLHLITESKTRLHKGLQNSMSLTSFIDFSRYVIRTPIYSPIAISILVAEARRSPLRNYSNSLCFFPTGISMEEKLRRNELCGARKDTEQRLQGEISISGMLTITTTATEIILCDRSCGVSLWFFRSRKEPVVGLEEFRAEAVSASAS